MATVEPEATIPFSRQLICGVIADLARVTVELRKGELVFNTKTRKK